ncbi:MAG: hypothetical protein GZ089_08675 [Aromatoleum sp.]|nr:hypothetical protein [Aromatoleum sp.]
MDSRLFEPDLQPWQLGLDAGTSQLYRIVRSPNDATTGVVATNRAIDPSGASVFGAMTPAGYARSLELSQQLLGAGHGATPGAHTASIAGFHWWGYSYYISKETVEDLKAALEAAAEELAANPEAASAAVAAILVAHGVTGGISSAIAVVIAALIAEMILAESCNGVNLNIPFIGPPNFSSA